MAEFKKYFIIFSFIFIFGASCALVGLNSHYKRELAHKEEASTSEIIFSSEDEESSVSGSAAPVDNTAIITNILYILSTILHVVTLVYVGVELIFRSGMSACMVYPCDLQVRTCCCITYSMPKFWLGCWIITLVNFIAEAVLVAMLFTPFGFGVAGVNIVLVAILVGLTLIQFILAIANWRLAVKDLRKELFEEGGELEGGSGHGLGVPAP